MYQIFQFVYLFSFIDRYTILQRLLNSGKKFTVHENIYTHTYTMWIFFLTAYIHKYKHIHIYSYACIISSICMYTNAYMYLHIARAYVGIVRICKYIVNTNICTRCYTLLYTEQTTSSSFNRPLPSPRLPSPLQPTHCALERVVMKNWWQVTISQRVLNPNPWTLKTKTLI